MERPDLAKESAALENRWREDTRWHGITRRYSAADVLRLRGTLGRSEGDCPDSQASRSQHAGQTL
jgi:isocitrate lyase